MLWPHSWVSGIGLDLTSVLLQTVSPVAKKSELSIFFTLFFIFGAGHFYQHAKVRNSLKLIVTSMLFCASLSALCFAVAGFRKVSHYWIWLHVVHFSAWILLIYIVLILPWLEKRSGVFSPNSTQQLRSYMLLSFSLLGIGSWMQIYPVLCPRHSFWAISPAIGLFVLLLYEGFGCRVLPAALVVVSLFIPLFQSKLVEMKKSLRADYVVLSRPPILAGMKVLATEAGEWEEIDSVISAASRRLGKFQLLLYGADALYAAFAPDLRNPNPFYVTWKFPSRPDSSSVREEFIHKANPLIFVQGAPDSLVLGVISKFHYVPLAVTKKGSFFISEAKNGLAR